jgi:hypothetical protein
MRKHGPCPFCGKIPNDYSYDSRHQFYRAVLCQGCQAIGPPIEVEGNLYQECEQKATDAWNKRTVQIQVDARERVS